MFYHENILPIYDIYTKESFQKFKAILYIYTHNIHYVKIHL